MLSVIMRKSHGICHFVSSITYLSKDPNISTDFTHKIDIITVKKRKFLLCCMLSTDFTHKIDIITVIKRGFCCVVLARTQFTHNYVISLLPQQAQGHD